ncbi:RrF2 family transcriptional regulator [Cyanobacterium aponinum UTEX 3222]|uniref:Transcriptional regulator, BadM/Rrf2 family n=3 Tax=Cyanobacterium aponinum TaxID=379064 RepID=K9Z3F3_CYAAP|nr:RrF2 family transcriptional regulator [Cyanobacterium aponinum]WRL40851.1 RrF2 family transcriptional regulator [Cyanobacterium aponinum UTEX 3222]AFZ52908.1 transcriptional regulator, BadM/Rrf2 family [Cyanobacterium aponinum PCC 10605]MTF37786.1 Rrf2 family transcriptional regulator [Cyanobacterium aponinum 0216]PHV63166.1 transcriptional regulator [Cyanobacterium aponinum IPPAS B-1201]WPF90374.1 RrF2 family transcriptional regulator [Cyanobacterium aponinum AL20115]
MKLTTKAHYAVKALLDLSLSPLNQPISVNKIADRQHIPAPYLEKILIQIRRAGLIKSVRGSQGGYQLAMSPEKISLGEILTAVGDKIEPLPDLDNTANSPEDWVTITLWKRLNRKLKEAIFEISLADLYYDARSRQADLGEGNNFIV